MIRRYNITMDDQLHDSALRHAKAEYYSDFSGLLTQLVRAELKKNATPRTLGAAGEVSEQMSKPRRQKSK
jgi:hypothetical protein